MNSNSRQKRSLQFLFVVTFLCQTIIGVVSITIPIYANILGASPLIVGLIGSTGGLIYSFVPFISGALCDRFGKKRFVAAAMILYGSACLLYVLVKEPYLLAFVKILEWSAIALFWPAVEALIAEFGGPKLEEALRKFNISWGSAMIVGPTIGGALISAWNVRAPLLFSLFISLSFGLLSLVLIREPDKTKIFNEKPTDDPKNDVHNRYPIMAVVASIFLLSSIISIILALFPSYAIDLDIPPFEIGLITLAFGVARTVTFFQANKVEEKIGKPSMFLLGSAFLGIASLSTFNVSTAFHFGLCFLLFGFGTGLSYAASLAFILRRWGSTKGHAAGIFESLIGLGYFSGPLIGGFVSEYAPNAPYLYGAALSLIVFLIHLISKHAVSTN